MPHLTPIHCVAAGLLFWLLALAVLTFGWTGLALAVIAVEGGVFLRKAQAKTADRTGRPGKP